MARSVLGFFLFYGRMGCPDFDGPELLHVACSIAKCLTKIWGDGFRNFLNGEVSNLSKDYFFSQYWGENLQWYSTVQWSRVACLQMFENVFIVGYILFFFFFNLSFTFYLVGGNILSLLSNVNPQNSSASVFTRVYTHERGYREQRILVVRHKIRVYRNRSFGKKPACFGQCFQFSSPRAKLSGQWTYAGTVPCPGHQQLGSF